MTATLRQRIEGQSPMANSARLRLARFMLNEVSKTIDRPSRLVSIPIALTIRIASRSYRGASFVSRILPDRWIKRLGGQAFCHATGHVLFQQDKPEQAWLWLKKGLQMGPSTIGQLHLAALCLYHGLGRFQDAMSLFARANKQGLEEAASRGLANIPFRVLDSTWARHIGHNATIDYVIKLGILEGRRPEDTVLYLPPGSPVANPFLLRQISEHLRLVKNSTDLPFDPSAIGALHFDYMGPCLTGQTTTYFWELAGKTYKQWHQEGRGPILTLPAEIDAAGRGRLHDLGLPHNAWFVALHVREGKWDGRNPGMHGVLNADISTYLPAISEITRHGGWVLRMGDPSMGPMPQLPNLIDYCHSNLRADWMDVFIAARCRFLLGTSSGPAYIPPLYGTPSVLTNWWPPAQRPWHAFDIFIPKMLRRQVDGRQLSLSETLCEPFSYCHSRRFLADHSGVYIEDNDAEIIRAAVVEMLARLDGNSDDDAEVAELRSRADRIYQAHDALGMGILPRDFLRQQADFVR
jgi:putative glycosyltransferase (TIGR04372 family)